MEQTFVGERIQVSQSVDEAQQAALQQSSELQPLTTANFPTGSLSLISRILLEAEVAQVTH